MTNLNTKKSLAIAAMIIFNLFAFSRFAVAQNYVTTVLVDNIYYNLYSDGTAHIPLKNEHRNISGPITLQETINFNNNNYTLTVIESHAFGHAFDIDGTLTIPPTVTSIGTYAFYGCCFEGELVIPNSVLTVGEAAFTGYFTSIVVGDGVTEIGRIAFSTAGDLASVVLGTNVQSIGLRAFWSQSPNPTELYVECKSAIPPTMEDYVFENRNVVQVTVPSCILGVYQANEDWNGYNLYERGENAKIGSLYYVLNCAEKTAMVTHENYTEEYINYGTYSSYTSIGIPATVTYNDETYSVTRVGNYAFSKSTNLGTISIGNNVETLGDYAFYQSPSLTNVTFGENLQTIGNYAFLGCSSLGTVSLGDNLQTIGNYAFYDCSNLTTVSLGSALQYIGSRGFMNCDAITSITSKNTVPPTLANSYVFRNVPTSATLNVPCTAMEAYAAAAQWQNFDIQSIPLYENAQIDGVYYVLETCALTATVTHAGYTENNTDNGSYSGDVVIPATVVYQGQTIEVTRIGNHAFRSCDFLSSVTIGDNVESIGNYAFVNCESLSNLTLGANVRTIGDRAFRGCALTSLVLDGQVESIGNYAFSECNALASVVLGGQVESLGQNAFNGCTALTSAVLGGNLQHISGNAFRGCTSLADVRFGTQIQTFGNYAFYGCSSLTSVALGNNVTSIGTNVFDGCTSLEEVVFGSSLTGLGSYAFRNCSSISSITCKPTTPPSISNNTFSGVPATATLYVPCGSEDTYASHNRWSRFDGHIQSKRFDVLVEGLYYELPCEGEGNTATLVYDPSYDTLEYARIEDFEYMGEQYAVTAIADNALDGFDNLLGVDCRAPQMATIGANAFRNCTGIEYFGFYENATPPDLGDGALDGLTLGNMMVVVPFCSQYDYSVHPVWGQFGIIFPDGNCEYNFTNHNGDRLWSNELNWEEGVVPGEGVQVAIKGDCEMDMDVTVGSITLGPNYATLTVKTGNTLTATNYIYNPDEAEIFIIEDGAQVFHPNAGAVATVKKNIEAHTANGGWNFISSPLAENLTPTADNGFLANEYDLYFYDEPAHYWRNHKPGNQNSGFSIEPLKGYLYANNTLTTLQFQGELQPNTAVTIDNLSHSADVLTGFNLVGNPFAHNVTNFTGNNVADDYYRMNEAMDELIVSTISAANPLLPGEGFFVKATGDGASLTFNDNSAKGSERSLSQSKGRINLELRESGYLIDRLIVKNDGESLEKFTLRENGTRIYATEGAQDYAVIVIASDSEAIQYNELPVNFKAAKNGTYTLNVNVENMDLDYLHLIDNITGADVDLLQTNEYTFTAKTTDYASRFRLVFSPICEDANGDNETFAYVSNGNIIVNGEGTLQVVDMMGRVIVSVGGHTRCVPTNGMTPGVYVLRLIDGNDVKTQKIVID